LIGDIIAADDVIAPVKRPAATIAPLLDELRAEADRALYRERDNDANFIHALAAACAFYGDYRWARSINALMSVDLPVRCEHCEHHLALVANSQDGAFIAVDRWWDQEESDRSPIKLDEATIDSGGRRLITIALEHGREDIAEMVRNAYGTAQCPYCAHDLDLKTAIGDQTP
jgi:hypothetical protein